MRTADKGDTSATKHTSHDKMLKNLIIRTLTGAVYVLLLIGCTTYSPVTAFGFFSIVTFCTLLEFGSIVNKYEGASVNIAINALAGFMLVAASWLLCIGSNDAYHSLCLYGILLMYLLVSELYLRKENPLLNWAYTFASQIYVAMPFALLPMLCLAVDEETYMLSYQWVYPLALFVFLWTNDTGAYLFGCTLSKYVPAKLFPRISPKKSWIGSAGGCLVTLLASVAMWRLFPDTLSLWRWVGFAVTVVVFGTWGDLVESLIKRHMGIKDSGHILPGHGGLLDRFDSALLAIPAVVIYMMLSQWG